MASITIPTVVTVTESTFWNYIRYGNNTDIQTLFDGDTNWVVDSDVLYYDDIPVFGSQPSSYIFPYEKEVTKYLSSSGGYYLSMTSGNNNIYIYNFSTFVVIMGYYGYGLYNRDNALNGTAHYCVLVLDKTNKEWVVPWWSSSGVFVVNKLFSVLDQNGDMEAQKAYPNDIGEGISRNDYGWSTMREHSASDVTYLPVQNELGTQASRFVFLKEFPELSVFETLHVDDKYFFVLPYSPYLGYYYSSWTTNKEVWCAVAIDVTDEINNS